MSQSGKVHITSYDEKGDLQEVAEEVARKLIDAYNNGEFREYKGVEDIYLMYTDIEGMDKVAGLPGFKENTNNKTTTVMTTCFVE